MNSCKTHTLLSMHTLNVFYISMIASYLYATQCLILVEFTLSAAVAHLHVVEVVFAARRIEHALQLMGAHSDGPLFAEPPPPAPLHQSRGAIRGHGPFQRLSLHAPVKERQLHFTTGLGQETVAEEYRFNFQRLFSILLLGIN